MGRLGVVLAAGDSTRLPNKCLLPMRSGFVLQSAVEFLRGQCDEVYCVVKPGPVEVVVKRIYPSMRLVYQKTAQGVHHALHRVNRYNLVVAFSDCIYHPAETVPDTCKAIASIRPSVGNLDVWATDHWADRGTPGIPFLGWMFVPQIPNGDLDTVGLLNALGASPYSVKLPCWDIGTPEAYERYWNENDRRK